MICVGIRIDIKTVPSLENGALVLRYLSGCVLENEMMYPMEALEAMVRRRFGYHLRLRYGDPETGELYDEPIGQFVLTLVSESYFYSKEMQ